MDDSEKLAETLRSPISRRWAESAGSCFHLAATVKWLCVWSAQHPEPILRERYETRRLDWLVLCRPDGPGDKERRSGARGRAGQREMAPH
jgi:hypothetical protein